MTAFIRLGDVAKVGAGNSAPQGDDFFEGGEFPFIRTSDVGRIRFGGISSAVDNLNETGAKGLRLFPKGTILFPKSGASTFLNHRVMMDVDGYVSSHLATITADESKISSRFLLYFLSTVQAQDLVQDHAYPSLNLPIIASLNVPLASLTEQRRIVGILDDAFASIATAKVNTEQNLRNSSALFDSEVATIFESLTTNHVMRPLGDLCERVTVGYVGPMASRYVPAGVPFLRSQNTRPFRIDLEGLTYIDREFHSEIKKSALRPGDVAVVRTGYPGTAAVVPASLPVSNCSDLVIVRPSDRLDPDFLALFFNSDYGKRMVAGKLVGAAQKHFNVTAAKEVLFPVLTRSEQSVVVEQCHTLRGESQRLESLYTRKLAALDELKQSLLQQAFSGQL